MMSWPKHVDPKQDERKAVAPYNFVPLPEKVIQSQDPANHGQYQKGRYTGYFDCTLTTASPLYVRCGLTPEEFREAKEGKGFPDFFYTDPLSRKPVIPGSSLRGMLRGLVEIIGYAKVQPVSDERLVYRSVGDTTSLGNRYRQRLMREDRDKYFTPLMLAGYIEKIGREWYIRPAKSIGNTTFARIKSDDVPPKLSRWFDCKNAYKIWFRPGPYEYKKIRGGFIHINTPMLKQSLIDLQTEMI